MIAQLLGRRFSRNMNPNETPLVTQPQLFCAAALSFDGPDVHAASSPSHRGSSGAGEKPADLFADDGDHAG